MFSWDDLSEVCEEMGIYPPPMYNTFLQSDHRESEKTLPPVIRSHKQQVISGKYPISGDLCLSEWFHTTGPMKEGYQYTKRIVDTDMYTAAITTFITHYNITVVGKDIV